MKTFLSQSEEETRQLGYTFGKQLPKNSVVYFLGELGAGKTTFIKGLTEGISGFDPDHVNSPTFSYLNIYPGTLTVYHFDLYRMKNSAEFLSMGFEDYFDQDGICCIEWSERIADLLPSHVIAVTLTHVGQNLRQIQFSEGLNHG
jgi:tRNA threonylcarbamoyladenosine biosynthesis protein TsaE